MIRILLSTLLGERRWPQSRLAEKTGIRAATINLIFHELTDRISLEQLDKICEALQCDISDILVIRPESEASGMPQGTARQHKKQ